MRRMAQLLASRVSALSAAAVRPSVTALGHSLAPAPVLAQRASLRTLAPFLNGPARPHAPGLSQIRAMTEEASPVLADVLREEVKYEQENYKQPEEVKSVPEPWTLKDEPGSTHVMLERKYENEKVVVDLLIHEQEDQNEDMQEGEGEEGEDVDVDVGISFSVSIVKNSRALVFDCTSDGSYVEIVHVSLADEAALTGDEDDEAYEGPVYQELDEKLQQAFEDMLSERGVTPELGEYLMRLSEDKEQREYMGWLQRVADVIQ